MINLDVYGRPYTQLAEIAHQFKVPDTRDIYVMKIPDSYRQKLIAEGLRVKMYKYDKTTNTYRLPPSVGESNDLVAEPIPFTMTQGELLDYQLDIIRQIHKATKKSGFIVSGTATGKSFMLAGLIALYKRKTIIVVPNIAIARGLLEKLFKWSSNIYLAQGAKILSAEQYDIVICHHTTFNTHYEYINGKYDTLIIDEGHHQPVKRIHQIIERKGGHIFGLSATPKRKEFDERGIEMLFGKMYNTGKEALPVKVLIHKFRYDYSIEELETASQGLAPDSVEIFRRLIINNEKRYDELLKILSQLKLAGYKKYIIFSDRVEHIKKILDLLRSNGYNAIEYYGHSDKDDSETKIKSSDEYIIVGHPTSCGEGFDIQELEVAILYISTGWENAIKQMAGRARRYAENKKEGILVDFVDQISIMGGKTKSLSFGKRTKVYKQLDWETTAL